jgi:hypothetical protein
MISTAEQMLPLLKSLTGEFKDTPGVFAILKDIAGQFRTDSGSSLRDVINRLEALLQVLQSNVDAMKILDEQDRAKATRIAELLDQLTAKVGAMHNDKDGV